MADTSPGCARVSGKVGVATEMVLTKAEQVSDDGACAAGLRLKPS